MPENTRKMQKVNCKRAKNMINKREIPVKMKERKESLKISNKFKIYCNILTAKISKYIHTYVYTLYIYIVYSIMNSLSSKIKNCF